jgi:hypothetical protein
MGKRFTKNADRDGEFVPVAKPEAAEFGKRG